MSFPNIIIIIISTVTNQNRGPHELERERERERELGTGILFEEPNPTGSRPRGLIGLYRKWQRAKSRDPNQLGSIGNGKQERERGANTSKVRRARRRWWHGGSKWGEVKHREEGGGDRGSTAARPTLTRNWGGPQVALRGIVS